MRVDHDAPHPSSAQSQRDERLKCKAGVCRGHPECPHRLCNGHPLNDPEHELDPIARARFWMTYVGLLMMVLGGLALWWIG